MVLNYYSRHLSERRQVFSGASRGFLGVGTPFYARTETVGLPPKYLVIKDTP